MTTPHTSHKRILGKDFMPEPCPFVRHFFLVSVSFISLGGSHFHSSLQQPPEGDHEHWVSSQLSAARLPREGVCHVSTLYPQDWLWFASQHTGESLSRLTSTVT